MKNSVSNNLKCILGLIIEDKQKLEAVIPLLEKEILNISNPDYKIKDMIKILNVDKDTVYSNKESIVGHYKVGNVSRFNKPMVDFARRTGQNLIKKPLTKEEIQVWGKKG